MRFFTNWDNQHPFLKYINFFGPRFDPFILLFSLCFGLVYMFVFVLFPWFGFQTRIKITEIKLFIRKIIQIFFYREAQVISSLVTVSHNKIPIRMSQFLTYKWDFSNSREINSDAKWEFLLFQIMRKGDDLVFKLFAVLPWVHMNHTFVLVT